MIHDGSDSSQVWKHLDLYSRQAFETLVYNFTQNFIILSRKLRSLYLCNTAVYN
jgi:hypothetical protein